MVMNDMTIGDITGLLPENSMFKQGDVWAVDLGKSWGHEQGGKRPVVIISATSWNARSKTPMVCPCTTSSKKGDNEFCVEITFGDKTSFANTSHVYTLSVERFTSGSRLGKIDKNKRIEIAKKVKRLLYAK